MYPKFLFEFLQLGCLIGELCLQLLQLILLLSHLSVILLNPVLKLCLPPERTLKGRKTNDTNRHNIIFNFINIAGNFCEVQFVRIDNLYCLTFADACNHAHYALYIHVQLCVFHRFSGENCKILILGSLKLSCSTVLTLTSYTTASCKFYMYLLVT